MVLKWISSLVAATSAGSFATLCATAGSRAPVAVQLVLVAICAAAVVLVVVAELYQRLDARLGVLTDFLVVRLDDIVGRLDRLEAPTSLEALFERSDPEPAPVVSLVPRRPARP